MKRSSPKHDKRKRSARSQSKVVFGLKDLIALITVAFK